MSCTDVQTIQAGNGTKTQFSFDFPYIFKSEIHVYFWNATTKEYDEKLTTDGTYPWQITDANPTIVEFTSTAPPAPATPVDPGEPTVDNVKIRRITKIDDIRALFNPGSAIRSDDLNNNFEQLKYAIQESNCPGIPDDVDQYLKDYYWDRYDNTLYAGDTWVSNDTKIATTAALDARFQDEVNDTFTKAELAAASDVMPNNDNAVPTTGALKNFTDHVIENDILVDGTGLNKTTANGKVTIGISSNSVDFDRLKNSDKVRLADQEGNYDLTGGDSKVFTASAAIRRFENYVQNSAPSGTGVGKGAVWVDVDDDLTLSVWNGTNWVGITSGGTFTNQPKVVYVDASSGDDSNDGHRISRPKRTIKAAVNQVNTDSTYGDGSVIVVAAGVYQEAAPIQIQKKNVSIVGQALRSCIVHPTVATQGDQSAGNHALFELNSGSFIQNLTLTGMKANNSGTNTLDSDLPANQGWNFAFYSGATITKSPYIQNCTNFSDSEIDNSDLNANTPAGGLAGDLDSAPTGGGMLVDGSVLATTSPLRSMVADSYTHVGLNGPGILVTNNGYAQCTSSYAFFNKYHIKTLNGGQANLAASTTDFGDKALVADGKSTVPIFTSNVDGAAASGAISFNINEPTAGVGWFGDTERPGTNMLVEVNSVIYPILSATANTDSEGNDGWTVTISRPSATNRSNNLGLNGAISDNQSVKFYLRSMIASSGHTMEYVGSGTDYRALPENGGVPNEDKQITELNDGKIWTAITDHNGKFKIGGNQTDDPIFEVDQQLGFVTIPEGSISFNLLSDETPELFDNLDANNKKITDLANPTAAQDAATKNYVDTSSSNLNYVAVGGDNMTGILHMGNNRITNVGTPTGDNNAATKNYVDTSSSNTNYVAVTGDAMTGSLAMGNNKITGLGTPTANTDAATKSYVDTTVNATNELVEDTTPQLGGNLDMNGNKIVTTSGNANIILDPHGTGNIQVAACKITGVVNPTSDTDVANKFYVDNTVYALELDSSPQLGANLDVNGYEIGSASNGNIVIDAHGTGSTIFKGNATERLKINQYGTISINSAATPSNATEMLVIKGAGNNNNIVKVYGNTDTNAVFGAIGIASGGSTVHFTAGNNGSAVDSHASLSLRTAIAGSEATKMYISQHDNLSGTGTYANFFGGTADNVTGHNNSLQIQGGSNERPRLSLVANDTTVVDGNELGRFDFWNNDGGWHSLGYIRIKADEDFTSTAKGSILSFGTTGLGATTPNEHMYITAGGTVHINNTLNVRAAIDLADNDVLRFGSGDDAQMVHDGANLYLKLLADDDLIITDENNSSFKAFRFDSSARRFYTYDAIYAGWNASTDGYNTGTTNSLTTFVRDSANQTDTWTSSVAVTADWRGTLNEATNESTHHWLARIKDRAGNESVASKIDVNGVMWGFGSHYAGRTQSSTTGTPTNYYNRTGTGYGFHAYNGSPTASGKRYSTGYRAFVSMKAVFDDADNRKALYMVKSDTDGNVDIDADQYCAISAMGRSDFKGGIRSGRVESDEATPNSIYAAVGWGGGNGILSYVTNGSSYTGIYGRTTANSDAVFRVRVNQTTDKVRIQSNGSAFTDGTWSNTNADYAEFFEWEDGNPTNEDRRGVVVVLTDEGKIREATSTDSNSDIIGVISANPAYVGDDGELHWSEMYLKDAFGSYVTEPAEYLLWKKEYQDGVPVNQPVANDPNTWDDCISVPVDEIDTTQGLPQWAIDQNCRVTKQEQVLNPDYDPTQVYIPRSERQEWDAVGLIGKLIVKDGQQIGANWKSMGSVGTGLTKYFVR